MTIEQENHVINGQRIVITGGTTGIGRETALQLAELGGNILIAGQDRQHLQDTLNDGRNNGKKGAIDGIVVDLSTDEGITKLFAEADAVFGGNIDVFINNAALAFDSVLAGQYHDWRKIIDTNLLAYVACSRMAADRMAKSNRGQLVLIGSMSAKVREADSSVYVATKAGVEGFAESFRKEVNSLGIRVTLIEPGAVNTDMQPQTGEEKDNAVKNEEMLQSSDVANAVIYALSQHKRCDVVEIRLRPRLQLI